MEKEINEQPDSVARAFAGRFDMEKATAKLSGYEDDIFQRTNKITAICAGSSYYSSLFGGALIEKYARIPFYAEISSEFAFKNPIVGKDDVYIAVSQSGETADTRDAMTEVHEKGGKVFGICNVPSSATEPAREAIDYLNKQGKKVGMVAVHLYRPFSVDFLKKALPATVKRIAVLDRTKEPGAEGEPLYLDVKSALYDDERKPLIVGGRYGLGSSDTTPAAATPTRTSSATTCPPRPPCCPSTALRTASRATSTGRG